jgi:hypothetical protein
VRATVVVVVFKVVKLLGVILADIKPQFVVKARELRSK